MPRLVKKLEAALETKAVVLPFGTKSVKRAGIVSGGADFAIGEAIDRGCDVFITGETSHVAFHVAKEARINIIYAGHYASETVGLRALARHVHERFSIDCTFISAPTGF
jgi:putative NIF3 family GTP cyclohydrolase 1 type 2